MAYGVVGVAVWFGLAGELSASRVRVVSYANWAWSRFSSTQLLDQAICGTEADPDGDGIRGTNYTVGVYTGTPPSVTSWDLEAIGDFDGDGKDDLSWRHLSNGARVIWYGNGLDRAGEAVPYPSMGSSWTAKVGYFDGDKKADLLWRDSTSGTIVVALLDGSNVVTNATMPTISMSWAIEGVGDMDGDGKDDILWRNTSTDKLAIGFMDGASCIATSYYGTVSSRWAILP